MAKKFYAVWEGREIGVFDSWERCEASVKGHKRAGYKSARTEEEAREILFKKIGEAQGISAPKKEIVTDRPTEGIAVDGACSGNPGDGEWRIVDIETGREIFRSTEFYETTNNVMEFLALVFALFHVNITGSRLPVYSDSVTAMAWVRNKKAKTKVKSPQSADAIEKAEKILRNNDFSHIEIRKWDTKKWGEIPADFGRK